MGCWKIQQPARDPASSLVPVADPGMVPPPNDRGEVSEWSKVPDSKSGEALRPPWVRIPPSPPTRRDITGPPDSANLHWPPGPTPPEKATKRNRGEVSEWPKVHDWKSCVAQATAGSNPALSANFGLTLPAHQTPPTLPALHYRLARLRQISGQTPTARHLIRQPRPLPRLSCPG
jgi:hypothetical protein